jgi:hypothetical protein
MMVEVASAVYALPANVGGVLSFVENLLKHRGTQDDKRGWHPHSPEGDRGLLERFPAATPSLITPLNAGRAAACCRPTAEVSGGAKAGAGVRSPDLGVLSMLVEG